MPEQIGFRRNMGLFMAVMIGIGATMGPGIFALPGELAHMIGPLGVLVYLAMGFLTVFTALNYSELSAAIPLSRRRIFLYQQNSQQTGGVFYRLVLLDR